MKFILLSGETWKKRLLDASFMEIDGGDQNVIFVFKKIYPLLTFVFLNIKLYKSIRTKTVGAYTLHYLLAILL